MVGKVDQDKMNKFQDSDIDQSLYSWRGARPEYFSNFKSHYPNGQILELSQNYRSTKNIINAADGVICHNVLRIPKKMNTDNDWGEKIRVVNNRDSFTETASIATTIRQLRLINKYKWSDFAILYRTNAQSRSFEDQFMKLQIPYEIIGAVSFYERKEIKDITSFLRLLANKHDDPAMIRVLELQPGIGKTTITKAMDAAKDNNSSIYTVVLQNVMFRTRKTDIYNFVSNFDDVLQMYEDPTSLWELNELIDLVFMRFYDHLLDKKDKIYDSRLDNINELKNIAIDYKLKTVNPTLSGFLEVLALHTDQDDIKDGTNLVKLMTGHACKGLEFPVVFIVNAEEGLIPHEKCSTDAKQLEEERRIFFVMMTRAQERLYITYAANRRARDGTFKNQVLSRFVTDIPFELKENKVNW